MKSTSLRWLPVSLLALGLFVAPSYLAGAQPAQPSYLPAIRPPVSAIPDTGDALNFKQIAHVPIMDDFQWNNDPMGIPRGDNGDITMADHCVYVGAIMGYQPAVIVDVSDPPNAKVVGPVPDLVPGVMNGGEGIEAVQDLHLLVIDQRQAIDGLAFDPPPDLPARGLAIYDISDCTKPRLVARYDYQGEPTHTVSLWHDPQNPVRVLAIETFDQSRKEVGTDIRVIDLTGCPSTCQPKEVAKWGLTAQFGIPPSQDLVYPGVQGSQSNWTHEAVMSTDGNRIYMAEMQAGFFMLDSSRLVNTLRQGGQLTASPGPNDCNPEAPQASNAEDYCITILNPDINARDKSVPPIDSEWYHTAVKVPDRPYMIVNSESREAQSAQQNNADPNDALGPVRPTCPGSFLRVIYVGDQEYYFTYGDVHGLMRGDLYPKTVGVFGTMEQLLENCTATGPKPGTQERRAAFSLHNQLALPHIVFTTYYGGGLRAIDITNPFTPVEVGHFFGKPVDRVRWAHEIYGDTVMKPDGSGLALMKPSIGPPDLIHFSYVDAYNGYLIFGDINNGLYIVQYTGPHADEIPAQGICLSGNPGAIKPGFEPCAPYGQTNWGTAPQ